MIKKELAQRLAEIRAKGTVYREATVGLVDIEARTAELSFSSEAEYERWWGVEVLSHDPAHANFARLNDGGALLWNHNWDDQRGVVESGTAHIGADKKGRAVVRFSKSAAGEELMQDVADKIKTKVSVGYMVNGIKLLEERENVDVYLVNDWEAIEISIVSVPADTTVGVGRSMENPPEEPPSKGAENPIINKSNTKSTEDSLPMIKIVRAANGDLVRAEVDDAGAITTVLETLEKAGAEGSAAAARGAEAERSRSAAILAMGEQYAKSVPTARELAAQMVREGKTEKDMQDALLKAFNERAAQPLSEQNGNAHIGMDDKDVRRYSMVNVIRALANPNDQAAQKAAAFEIECSINAQKALGRSAKGMMVPPDVLSRAMTTTQSNAGATMVQTDVMQGSFIDLLRNRTTIMQLATVVSGLVGNVDIPKATGDGQAYWLGEGQDATETGFTMGQLSFSPKTLGAYTDVTRRLLQQTSASVEGMIRTDLIRAIATAIDKAGFYGTGSDYQPRGLKNQPGINAVAFGASGQGKPTFAELVQMETEIAADNADIGSLAYVAHSRFRGHAKVTSRFGTGTESTIWEPGNTVNGYRTEITNQVNQGDVFFGNFADFLVLLWGGLDLTVDPYTLSKSGGLRIVAFQDVDMGLRRPESICLGG